MNTIPLGLVIESLVAILLVLTIAYCMVLNRRLKRLRADEESLRATISELLTATEIAERAIGGLKSTAADCDKTLAMRLEQAEHFSSEIANQIVSGDDVLKRLARVAMTARDASAVPAAPRAPVVASPAPTVSTPSQRFQDLDRAARAMNERLQRRGVAS